jgi:4-diphosphocytidyl-2-C-methyl-D-erythritol kinase
MSELWVSNSYAKINLGLNILERLPNGYHTIETGFCFIEWNDRFEVRTSSNMRLELSEPTIPIDDSNLIIKAIKLLQKEAGLRDKYKIYVHKRIPAGAGLGGGSSNAATTLRMLNKISNLDLSIDDLATLGKKLGADVPFFIHGKAGIGSGLGDKIEFLDIQPDAYIITVFPDVFSSTPEAYQSCIPNSQPDFSLRNLLVEQEIEEWNYLLQNDLEPAVIPRHELVGNLKDQFYDYGATFASMSGSGSSVFGIFMQDFVAIEAYESFHSLNFSVNLTQPCFKPDVGVYKKN